MEFQLLCGTTLPSESSSAPSSPAAVAIKMGCGSYQCSVGTASHPGQPPALPASSHWTLAFLPLPLPSPFYQPNTTTSIPESQTALWFTTRKWLSVGREDCFLRDWRWPSSYQTQSNTVSLPSLHSRSSIICHIMTPFIHSFIWLHRELCGILVPWTGMEPSSPALEGRVLNHWTTEEVSIPSICLGKHTDWNCPPWPGTKVTICMSYFTTGLSKEPETNQPPPTRRVWERSKGDATGPTASQNPSCWLASVLAEQCMCHQEGPRVKRGWPKKSHHHKTWECKPRCRTVPLDSLTLLSAWAPRQWSLLLRQLIRLFGQSISEC